MFLNKINILKIMATIEKLKKEDKTIYPITSINALVDENGLKVQIPTKKDLDNSLVFSVINHTNNIAHINPNVLNVWEKVKYLTITLADADINKVNEYMIQFESGITPTTLNLPNSVRWVTEPIIESKKIYQISILNNIALMVGVNSDYPISFKFNSGYSADSESGEIIELQAINGMTWEEWINSEYNTEGWIIESEYQAVKTHLALGDNPNWVHINGHIVLASDLILKNKTYYSTWYYGE